MTVLNAVKDASFNMVHICGPQAYFDIAADYPVHAINWATVGQQNPTLAQGQQRTPLAVVGGVDEVGVLQHGSPDDVISAARKALGATNGRRVLLSPGCSVAMDTPTANLQALRQAAEPAA
jgi:uroporphyrinogen decarboxylase